MRRARRAAARAKRERAERARTKCRTDTRANRQSVRAQSSAKTPRGALVEAARRLAPSDEFQDSQGNSRPVNLTDRRSKSPRGGLPRRRGASARPSLTSPWPAESAARTPAARGPSGTQRAALDPRRAPLRARAVVSRTPSAHSCACNKCMRMGAVCGGASRAKAPGRRRKCPLRRFEVMDGSHTRSATRVSGCMRSSTAQMFRNDARLCNGRKTSAHHRAPSAAARSLR